MSFCFGLVLVWFFSWPFLSILLEQIYTLCRGGLVISSASSSIFLKGSIEFSQVNFHMWLMVFLMHLHNIPPGRLTAAQLLGASDCSELVFCVHFVRVGRFNGPKHQAHLVLLSYHFSNQGFEWNECLSKGNRISYLLTKGYYVHIKCMLMYF